MDESQHLKLDQLVAEVSTSTSDDLGDKDFSQLRSQLTTEAEKVQLQVISELADCGDAGLAILMEFLLKRQQFASANFVDGKAYEILLKSKNTKALEFLQTNFPAGVIPLHSGRGLDYEPLQKLLAEQKFQAADQLTLQKLCAIAGPAAVQRKWLYFTEIDRFPATDLQTINRLWLAHSEGKFGFSVQRQIWLSVGKNWDAFWPKIGWKTGNNWTRYPQEFTWDLTAPRGHLPLSNQLRGVRVINSLLSHPAWSS
jgi:hypothetical protein